MMSRSFITPLFLILCLALQGFAAAQQNPDSKKHNQCKDKSNYWTDTLKNDCGWYGEYSNLRCMWSGTLKGLTSGASDICCTCGGGIGPTPSPTPSPSYLDEGPLAVYHVYSDFAGKYVGFQNNKIRLYTFKNRFTKIALVPDDSVLEGVRLKFMDPVFDTYISMDSDASIVTSNKQDSSVFSHTSIFIDDVNISTFMTKALGKQFYLAVDADDKMKTVSSEDNARAKFSIEKDMTNATPAPTPAPSAISYIKSNIINKYIGYKNGEVMLLSAKNFFTQIVIEKVQGTSRAVDRVRLKFVNPKVATYIMLGNNGVITTTIRPTDVAASVFVQITLSGKSVFRGVSKGVHYYLEVRNGVLSTSKNQGNGALFKVEDVYQTPTMAPTIPPSDSVISFIKANNLKKFIGFKNGQVKLLNAKNAFSMIIIEEVTNSRAVDMVRIKFVNPRAATYLRLGNNGSITTTVNPNTVTAEFIKTTFDGLSTFKGIGSNGINYFLQASNGNLSTSRSQSGNALFRVENTESEFDGQYFVKHTKSGGYMSFYKAAPGVTVFKESYEEFQIEPIDGSSYYSISNGGKYLSVQNESVVKSNTVGFTERFDIIKEVGKESVVTIKNVFSGRYLLGPFEPSNYDVLETTTNPTFARAKFELEKISD